MRNQCILCFLMLSLTLLFNCSTEQKRVVIYGSNNCDHCINFKSNLDQENITYTFKEVDTSDSNMLELQQKIQATDYKGYVSFPVVLVEEKLLINPPMDVFLMALK